MPLKNAQLIIISLLNYNKRALEAAPPFTALPRRGGFARCGSAGRAPAVASARGIFREAGGPNGTPSCASAALDPHVASETSTVTDSLCNVMTL